MRQIELLQFAVAALERLEIPYAIVGSLASSAWGEPRMTRDIDIVVRLCADQVQLLCAAFPDDEFYVSRSAATDAVRRSGQFNVIHPTSGNKIDFMVAGNSDWNTAQLDRRKMIQFDVDVAAYVAMPEDIILGKLLYHREGGSEKHLRDIAGILKTSAEIVDQDYIARYAVQLGVADAWQQLLDDIN